MNVFLFIVTIVVSFIVVRLGAIAFELTGLQWSLAKFQSLSCFTGTGFTTKEAELITGHPQRRRIATVLMILGHAGFITLVATFANSLTANKIFPKITIPFLRLVVPTSILPWANLLVIVVVIYILYRITTQAKIAKKITDFLRRSLIRKDVIKRVTFEELAVSTGGYGITSIDIHQDSPIIDKPLKDSGLKEHDVTVLVIERNNKSTPNPSANTKILAGDTLICFGKLAKIKKTIHKTAEK
jgi:K+/H+ antiporter YhaU regulatory subunit KhtT